MGIPICLSQLREFASHLQQLQGALNDLTEEHGKSTQEWMEKQAHLEKELSTAMQDKKCLEEKNEILQGKLSQLEEHLAQLRENPPQDKGEVLGDVLQVGMHRSSYKSCVLGLVWAHVQHVQVPGDPVLRGAMVTEESC